MYLTQSLHRAVQQRPNQPMTVCGDRIHTSSETGDRVARLAGALLGLGVGVGDRVGMLSLNSDRYHEYFFATWWIGGVVNPLNTRWSAAEIAFALEDSQTAVLLVDDTFVPLLDEIRTFFPSLRAVVHCGDQQTPDGLLRYEDLVATAEPVEDLRVGGDTLAGIFYTGGTSGRPKGVMLTHLNLMTASLGSLAANHTAVAGGRALLSAPMFHLAALASWNGQNIAGGILVMLPSFEPAAALRLIEEQRINSMLLVPTMIQMLLRHPEREIRDLSSITAIQYGASPISETLLRQAQRAFPKADFVQGYGMTEAGPGLTSLSADDHHAATRLNSAGRPMGHVEVRVVDDRGNELPRGDVGEIIARGGNIMTGYWNRPEETAAALRDGWLYTGDGGYMDEDGYLFVVDRLKDMIISGGENVYSTEVENALASHPDVVQCAVIGVPDDRFGERVHAFLVMKPGTSLTCDDVRAHSKKLIAGYKSPRSITIVEQMPVSPAGKILKRELRRRFSDLADRTAH
ncbi:long-chain fatty acid--CoA ligase [Rhodococcus sp. IEGM 1307]|uniref:acyl-CoA synthetase n=1 Tax=Rhodococcus sp. IEGM 1307 TaxID=3047091 RepID=UPI0024B824E1|nr:long-chain fatty acid--CoA ligase [Rhodococcus sp. IEGM 1307]MDI9974428.1 long-chain fatty acid--CoA ligase [Rhodococcus sp. IEGM 1307]